MAKKSSKKKIPSKRQRRAQAQRRRKIRLYTISAVVIISIVVFALIAGQKQEKPKANPGEAGFIAPAFLIKEVNTLAAKNQFDAAIKKLENYLKHSPDTRKLNYNLGALYFNKKNYAKALGYFQKELKFDPDNAKIHGQIGRCFHQLRNPESSLRYYRKQAELEPGNWEPQYCIGALLSSTQQFQEAEVHLKKALAINPRAVNSLVELGKIYSEKGDSRRAEEHFRKGIEIDPHHPDANFNLGQLLIRQGKKDEGREILKKYRELAGLQDRINHYQSVTMLPETDFRNYFELGEVLFKQHRLDEALEAFKQCVFLDSTYWRGYLRAGMVELQKKNLPGAKENLEKAYTIAPTEFDVNYNLAHVFAFQKKRDKSLAHLENARKARPLRPEDTRFISEVFYRSGLKVDAVSLLEELVENDPQDHESLFLKGILQHSSGNVKTALKTYRQVREITPSVARYNIAWAMASLENNQTAGITSALQPIPDFEYQTIYKQYANLKGSKALKAFLNRN